MRSVLKRRRLVLAGTGALALASMAVALGVAGPGGRDVEGRDNPCPSELVCGRLIEPGTLTSRHVKDGAIELKDLARGARNALAGKPGPAGPAGAAGPPGAPGGAGPPGPTGATLIDYNIFLAPPTTTTGVFWITTACDPGMFVIGGGLTHNNITFGEVALRDSFPSNGLNPPAQGTVAWTVFYDVFAAVTVNAAGFAICMPVTTVQTTFAPEAANPRAVESSAGPVERK